jgi:hypothetical protein
VGPGHIYVQNVPAGHIAVSQAVAHNAQLRDRALIGAMTYAFARVGAVVAMRVENYFANGKRWWVRLHEKGGKRHEMPAHQSAELSHTKSSSRNTTR